jgi:hypothetical protein
VCLFLNKFYTGSTVVSFRWAGKRDLSLLFSIISLFLRSSVAEEEFVCKCRRVRLSSGSIGV